MDCDERGGKENVDAQSKNSEVPEKALCFRAASGWEQRSF